LSGHSVYETDVLVIGAGGGVPAALAASEKGADVVIVDKGVFGKSGSTRSSFGMVAGCVVPPDNQDIFFEDMVKGGAYLNNRKLVRIFVNEIAKGVIFPGLEQRGVKFDREGGNLILKKPAGHSYPRCVMASVYNALKIWRVLIRQMLGRNVEVLDEVMVTALLTYSGRVVGAAGIDMRTGEFVVFRAKATILATGGAGQLYGTGSLSAMTTTPVRNTGDGFAMAYRQGAELVDMEFVQYIPCNFVYPESLKGINISEPAIFDGAKLYNVNGERFMKKYDAERMEYATKDVLTRAIMREIREGRGTRHGGVWMDLTQLPRNHSHYGYITELAEFAGIDIGKEYVEVTPSVHYFMGGVVVDAWHESTIPGLYAVGEVAGGLHGANRIAGTSIAELITFGFRAGRIAAQRALRSDAPKIDWEQVKAESRRVYGFLEHSGRRANRPYEIRKRIQSIMWDKVGVIQDARNLQRALAILNSEQNRGESGISVANNTRRWNLEWIEALEVRNMLDVAIMITRASLLRTETRGAIEREDYPQRDDSKWLRNIYIKKEASQMKLFPRSVVMR
jgi:succinate dehydrogenase/fumarate reductase flavoprotein subunit